MARKHYHVFYQNPGCLPDSMQTYSRLRDAQRELVDFKHELLQGIADGAEYTVFGSAKSGIVGRETTFGGQYYASIESCTDDDCADAY